MASKRDTAAVQIDKEAADGLSNVLINAVEQADGDRGGYLSTLQDYRDAQKPSQEIAEPDHEGDCTYRVPLMRIYRNAFMARLSRALLRPNPIHLVDGRGEMGKKLEGAVEAFLQEQSRRVLRLADSYRPVLATTFDDGACGVYVTWETRASRRLRYMRQERAEIDAETGEVIAAQNSIQRVYNPEIEYDGPRLHVLPIDNVGVYPANALSVKEAQGVYVKLTRSGSDILAGLMQGIYDKDAVETLRAWPGEGDHTFRKYLEDRGISFTGSSYDADTDFRSLPFDVIEWYWRYADPKYPDEPASDWLITQHVQTRAILRAQPNPWGHGRRPIAISNVLPPKFGIIGESIGDLIYDGERILNDLLRYMVNGTNWRVNPMLAASSAVTPAEVKKWSENRRYGGLMRFNTDDINKALQPIYEGMNPNDGLMMVRLLLEFMETSTGFSRSMMGGTSSKNVTATEMQNMIEEGQELIMDMTDSAAAALTEVGELLLALNYEFHQHDSVRQLWDTVNPEFAGEDLEQVFGQVYDVSAAGTSATSNRALRRKRALEMYEVFKDHPLVQLDPTGKRFWTLSRDLIVEGFEKRQSEQIIGTEEEAAQLPMAQQAAQLLQMAEQLGMGAQGGQPGGGMPGEPAMAGGQPGIDEMMGFEGMA